MKCYTLIPRVSGTIQNWITLIPHIGKLGFDTIHLLPITQMGKSKSPYSSKNPFVIDPSYSDDNNSDTALKDFAQFVQILKEKNIKLCVDLVLNHLSVDNTMLKKYSKWTYYDENEEDNMKRAGWDDGEHWHKWEDLALLNYANNTGEILWEYMLEYAMFWADFAAQTQGLIRFDNLHSSYLPFTEYLTTKLKNTYPKIQFLSELFTDEDSLKDLINRYQCSYLLGTQWEHKMAPDLRDYLNYIHSKTIPVRYYLPVVSHDSGSIIQEYGVLDSAYPRMVISALMSSGDWGIVQGTEYALEQSITFIGELDAIPLNKKINAPNSEISTFITTLNDILTQYPLLSYKANCKFIVEDHQAIISCVRYAPKDTEQHILVFANLDIQNSYELVITQQELEDKNLNIAACYYDVLSKDTYTIDNTQVLLHFKPAEVKVLICSNLMDK